MVTHAMECEIKSAWHRGKAGPSRLRNEIGLFQGGRPCFLPPKHLLRLPTGPSSLAVAH
jgi:hypothetical protein